MLKHTKTTTLYRYGELAEEAKDKARDPDVEREAFGQDIKCEYARVLYGMGLIDERTEALIEGALTPVPGKDMAPWLKPSQWREPIHIQVEPYGSQGQGCNLYGTFDVRTLLENGQEDRKLPAELEASLKEIEAERGSVEPIVMPPNRSHTYSLWSSKGYMDRLYDHVVCQYEEALYGTGRGDEALDDAEAYPFHAELEQAVEAACEVMDATCHDLLTAAEDLVDGYRDAEWLYEGMLFEEDGTFYNYESEIDAVEIGVGEVVPADSPEL